MNMPFFARYALGTFFLGAVGSALLVACTADAPPADSCGYARSTEVVTFPPPSPDVIPVRQCLNHAPDIQEDGTPLCIVVDVRTTPDCDCTTPGLMPVTDDHAGSIDAAKELTDPAATCFCEVIPLSGEAAKACQHDVSNPPLLEGEAVQGYCYLDDDLGLGDNELLDHCASVGKHLLRVAGELQKPRGQTLVIFCAAKVCDDGAAE